MLNNDYFAGVGQVTRGLPLGQEKSGNQEKSGKI